MFCSLVHVIKITNIVLCLLKCLCSLTREKSHCVCTHVYVCVFVYAYVFICGYSCIFVCLCVFMYVCVSVSMCVGICLFV